MTSHSARFQMLESSILQIKENDTTRKIVQTMKNNYTYIINQKKIIEIKDFFENEVFCEIKIMKNNSPETVEKSE